MKHIFKILISTSIVNISAQKIKFQDQVFEVSNVHATVVDFEGNQVLKVERDLQKIAFDEQHLEKTVDEPTFLKLSDMDFENGMIEVKMFSTLQDPLPFEAAQGFIGLAFNINRENTAFESVYLRPKAARSDIQAHRNHSVQYFSYPDFKFEKLRKEEFKGQYETYADSGLNEWINFRIEVKDQYIFLYLNEQKYPAFIVNERKSKIKSGGIGLWVDIGTTAYFKDLKITKY